MKHILTALAILGLSAPAMAQQSIIPGDTARATAPKVQLRKIILVGDSTVAPVSGWGSAFCGYHVSGQAACLNLGRNGRSTRSYREEGSWDQVLAEASVKGYKSVYVLIQFGHNDQNHTMKVWTDLETEFPDNLRRFVKELRARGAIPILVTPMVRRLFDQGKLDNILAYASGQVRTVAAELNVPVIDLNLRSAALVSEMGPDESATLAQLPPGTKDETPVPSKDVPGPHYHFVLKADTTHLGDPGARRIAAMVAHDLAVAEPDLAGSIAP